MAEGWIPGKGRTFDEIRDLDRVKPGMVFRIRDRHGVVSENLVGHINPLGGVCDDCRDIERGDVVVEYRYLKKWKDF